MPVMPRPKKAQKISDRVMKKMPLESPQKSSAEKANKEPQFDRDIRTMIKR